MYENHRNNKSKQNYIPPRSITNFSIQDLFKGKNLDLVVATLLLTGKLKVDSVELFRSSPAVNVILVGKYLSQSENSNALAGFLEDNGNMTLDDVIAAFQQRMERKDMR